MSPGPTFVSVSVSFPCTDSRLPMHETRNQATNSPVNHVGMSVVLDDMPPLMWHAELGRSLPDLWAGGHHRGVQLHDLHDAVVTWGRRYGQRAWLRQLQLGQESGNRGRALEPAGFAVDGDLHARRDA